MAFATAANINQITAALVPGAGSGKYSGVNPTPKTKWEWRLNPMPRPINRHKTNIPSLDDFFGGGLPKGLSIFWGESGAGKSLCARNVAINQTGKVLYVCCEVLSDAPDRVKYPHVIIADYTKMRPSFQNAVNDLFGMIEELKPNLVVIDSLTSFLGVTNKALPESSIREGIWSIHLNAEGVCPIIGTSEVRGAGYNMSTAGGEAVKHGCTMLVYFYKHLLVREAQLVGFPTHNIGDIVYTIDVQKDKHGLACNRPNEVEYIDDCNYKIQSLRPKAVQQVMEK